MTNKLKKLITKIFFVLILISYAFTVFAESYNVNQDSIFSKMGVYLDFTIDKDYPQPPKTEEERRQQAILRAIKSTEFELIREGNHYIEIEKPDGWCAGFSAMWLSSKWISMQQAKYATHQNSNWYNTREDYQEEQNYDSFRTTIELITGWSPGDDRPITAEEKAKIKKFIYQAEYFQNIQHYASDINQVDLDKLLKCFKNKKLKKEYAIGALFTLEQLKEFLKMENILHEGRLIYITSHNHATALFKEGDDYYYFDPNCETGEVQTTSVDEVAELIFAANKFDATKPSPLGFRIFHYDSDTSDNITTVYPSQTEVLDKINPALEPTDKHYSRGDSSLIKAINIGSLESIKYFLMRGVNVNVQRDIDKATPLMLAIYYNNIQVVQLLLENPTIDLNAQDTDGDTALMSSISRPYTSTHSEIYKMLLKHPEIDPNIQNEKGHTALMFAIEQNNLDAIKAILETPIVDPDVPDKDGNTALIIAASKDNLDAVKILLGHPKVDINAQNKKGCTALMLAAGRENMAMVKELLANAKINLDLKK